MFGMCIYPVLSLIYQKQTNMKKENIQAVIIIIFAFLIVAFYQNI